MAATSDTPRRPRGSGNRYTSAVNVWEQLAQQSDPLSRAVTADAGVVAVALETARGDHYYMLKHPGRGAYYRLSATDYAIWQLIDGRRSVKQLVVEAFKVTGSLDLGRVMTLVGNLQAQGFLLGPRTDIWAQLRARLRRPTPKDVLAKAWGVFMEFEIPVEGLDGILNAIHRWGGFLLFAPLAVALWSVAAVAGVVMTILALVAERSGGPATFQLGLLGVALLAITFIHEFAHAITCKHAGAEVRAGGLMLFMGLPAFFINTTDIWTKPRRSRVAVSWAGPWSTLVCGGFMATFAYLRPDSPLARMFTLAALLCLVLTLINLNPLSETDGYYMLIDWLEFPLLRERALAFLRNDLRTRRREGKKLTGDERLFAWFGVGSSIWTVVGVGMGLYFWKSRVSKLLVTAWAAMVPWQRGVVVVFVVIFSVPLALGLYGMLLQPAVDRFLKPLLRRLRTDERQRRELLQQRMATLRALPFLRNVEDSELEW
ncbi:MAG: PqqD family peptide modification chaperone, partial [Chloroflexota bacterium]|nr:PqqD family peptide modification chaperone [Chloroflexota bacterium]